ncbi:BQ5605_C008g04958 [Microbotryum silenes-dioicae]|uniref:BQ5605_C008g04958 protein n=1 Tax=Microbotryum silenes-dioicae TaxID=796604 RepID=A0A2X0PDY0_9BASI|nr:BQ5605_C008g04958 [Microbotryum silenes-dioicae]
MTGINDEPTTLSTKLSFMHTNCELLLTWSPAANSCFNWQGNAAGQVRLDGDDGEEVGMCGVRCVCFFLLFSRARSRPRCTAAPTGVLFFVFSLFG